MDLPHFACNNINCREVILSLEAHQNIPKGYTDTATSQRYLGDVARCRRTDRCSRAKQIANQFVVVNGGRRQFFGDYH